MRRLLNVVVAASCLLVSMRSQAADTPDVALLERVMGQRAIGLVRLDLEKVTAEQLAIPLAAGQLLFNYSQIENPDEVVAAARALKGAGPRFAYLVIGAPATLGYLPEIFCVIPTANEAEMAAAEQTLRQLFHGPTFQSWQSMRLEGAVAIGAKRAVESNLAVGRIAGREIAAALSAAGDAPLTILLVPSPDQRRVIKELLPLAAAKAQGVVLTPELISFNWGMLAIGTDPQHALRIVTQHDSDAQAKTAAKVLQAALSVWAKAAPAGQGTELLQPHAVGQQVRIAVDEQGLKAVTKVIEPEIRRLTSATARAGATHKLKDVGLAFHEYADEHRGENREGRFPDAAIRDTQGRPLLSWRVLVLPYLQQNDLYREFHLDEPWDSEHNKQLISRMPEVYQLGSAANIKSGKTTVVLPIGNATIFPEGRGSTLKEITDGTAHSIMAVEASDDHAVTWTKPDDLVIDLEHPADQLGGHFGDGFLALMADGSVHYLQHKIGDKNIRARITRAGGEAIEHE